MTNRFPRSRPAGAAASSRTSERLSLTCAPLLIAALTATTPARAQTTDPAGDPRLRAEQQVAEAERLYDDGDYQGSLARLTRARGFFASPVLDFDFGLTYRALGRNREALHAFEQFLAGTKDREPELAARRTEASWHVDALRIRLLPAAPPTPPPAALAPSPPAVTARIEPREPHGGRSAVPVYRRWWFWTAFGVAATTITAGSLLLLRDRPGTCGSIKCTLGEYTLP